MGLMQMLAGLITGGHVTRGIEVFRENSEARAIRDQRHREQALAQFSREFQGVRTSRFDQFIDGLNRLPRPTMALGVIGLFVSAMIDPQWFALRMQGIALVPDPLWWLLGAIVTFYFGARYQVKSSQIKGDVKRLRAEAQEIASYSQKIEAKPMFETTRKPPKHHENAAFLEWAQKNSPDATK